VYGCQGDEERLDYLGHGLFFLSNETKIQNKAISHGIDIVDITFVIFMCGCNRRMMKGKVTTRAATASMAVLITCKD
jgi:hypothetical protein